MQRASTGQREYCFIEGISEIVANVLLLVVASVLTLTALGTYVFVRVNDCLTKVNRMAWLARER